MSCEVSRVTNEHNEGLYVVRVDRKSWDLSSPVPLGYFFHTGIIPHQAERSAHLTLIWKLLYISKIKLEKSITDTRPLHFSTSLFEYTTQR